MSLAVSVGLYEPLGVLDEWTDRWGGRMDIDRMPDATAGERESGRFGCTATEEQSIVR